jgi:hypothetical protein
VDICFGPKDPAKKANGIQTLPGKGWNTILCLYSPMDPWFDKTRRPGEIESYRERDGADFIAVFRWAGNFTALILGRSEKPTTSWVIHTVRDSGTVPLTPSS